MPSDPEELLRSIERTREELALTVDTIAGRLDPKLAAKRSFGKVRSGVSSVVDGARIKLGIDHQPSHAAIVSPEPEAISIPDSTVVATTAPSEPVALPHPELDPKPRNKVLDGVFASAAKAADAAKSAQSSAKQLPKPVIGGGLAALVALAAVIAVKRRQR